MTRRSAHAHFAAEAGSVRSARQFVATTLGAWGVGHLSEPAVLMTSELVTNAVVHAGSDCRVTVEIDAPDVTVAVDDASAALPALRAPGPEAVGGRGLVLVDALSDRWGTEDVGMTGKRVWFTVAGDADVRLAGAGPQLPA